MKIDQYTEQDVADLRDELSYLSDAVFEVNMANGWFDDSRTFGDDIALLHSEVSEALEAFRDQGLRDTYRWKSTTGDGYSVTGGPGDVNYDNWSLGGYGSPTRTIPKPEGVGSEAADILIRLLDFCHRHDIDLAGKTVEKLRYNATRGHKHGGKAL